MTMTYAFPDLHGRLDIFLAALQEVRAEPDDTLVFLGDYIDRGPKSAQLIAALRKLQETRPNTICLSGNHEYMMILSLDGRGGVLSSWIANGGAMTLASYTDGLGDLDKKQMVSDAHWIASLPFIHFDDHRVFVHAGVDTSRALNEQNEHDMHWKRYDDLDGTGYGGMHVVHGHTPDKKGPKTVGDRTALDVGGYRTGRYVVAVFDNDVPGGPQDIIEVRV